MNSTGMIAEHLPLNANDSALYNAIQSSFEALKKLDNKIQNEIIQNMVCPF